MRTRAMIAGTVLGLACIGVAGGADAPPSSQPAPSRIVPPGSMLERMLRQPTTGGKALEPVKFPPAIDATSGRGAVAPGAENLTLMREGERIVDRTGRLTRSADGQFYEFHFDADGQAMRDPPVVILPSLKLVQMETAIQSSARDLRFRITGEVTEYKGRNYVLLQKVVVVPDVVQPLK